MAKWLITLVILSQQQAATFYHQLIIDWEDRNFTQTSWSLRRWSRFLSSHWWIVLQWTLKNWITLECIHILQIMHSGFRKQIIGLFCCWWIACDEWTHATLYHIGEYYFLCDSMWEFDPGSWKSFRKWLVFLFIFFLGLCLGGAVWNILNTCNSCNIFI